MRMIIIVIGLIFQMLTKKQLLFMSRILIALTELQTFIKIVTQSYINIIIQPLHQIDFIPQSFQSILHLSKPISNNFQQQFKIDYILLLMEQNLSPQQKNQIHIKLPQQTKITPQILRDEQSKSYQTVQNQISIQIMNQADNQKKTNQNLAQESHIDHKQNGDQYRSKSELQKSNISKSRFYQKHSSQNDYIQSKQNIIKIADLQNKNIAEIVKLDYDSVYKKIQLKPIYQQQQQTSQIIELKSKEKSYYKIQTNVKVKNQRYATYQNQISTQTQSKITSKPNLISLPEISPQHHDHKFSIHKKKDLNNSKFQAFNSKNLITQEKRKIQFIDQTKINFEQIKTPSKFKDNQLNLKTKEFHLPALKQLIKQDRKIYKKAHTEMNEINNTEQQYQIKNSKQKNEERQKIQRSFSNTQNILSVQNPPIQEQSKFDLLIYLKIYDCLKTIQNNLRNPILLKNLKSYLQLIASGKIDKFQSIKIPSHKKKIIKNSFLYERVAIVIIAFSFASDTLNDSYKYLSNLLKFIISNHLIILKILLIEFNNNPSDVLTKQLKQIEGIQNKDISSNQGYQIIRDNNEILQQTIFRLSKYDHFFYENLKKFLKNSNKFTIEQNFYFILEYFAFFLNVCGWQEKIPFLSVAPNPYLPPIQKKKYTLILDLLEIMHTSKKPDSFRPYSQYFLDQISDYFEIVAFTLGFPNQVNKLIQNLDPKKRISHKLYKHHAIKSNNIYLKDLSRLGRDLSKVILIDSQLQQYQLYKENSIRIHPWNGRNNDTALAEICPVLQAIVIKNLDARQVVSRYKQHLKKNMNTDKRHISYKMQIE